MLRLILFCCFVVCTIRPGFAADIKLVSADPISQDRIVKGECTATLTGIIQVGDADKLDALVERGVPESSVALRFGPGTTNDDQQVWIPKANALCFVDSNGGNFEEALEIADFLQGHGWVAVVPHNSRCLSACAIAFLGGSLLSSNSDGGERAPFRVMDVSATVGFHAPWFPEGMDLDRKVPMSLALEFLRDGMGSIKDLRTNLSEDDFENAGARLPPTLMLDMLSHAGPDDFVYVDTIDKAGAYNIRLAGIPELAVDDQALFRLCDNAVTWAFGLHPVGDPALSSWSYVLCADTGDASKDADCGDVGAGVALVKSLKTGVSVGSRHQECGIKGQLNLGDDYEVTSNRVNGAQFERDYEPWATLPHYTPLADLARMKGSFKVSDYRELKPFDKYEAGSLNLASFLQALPGNVLVLDAKPDSDGSLIINFAKDGTAEILWPEGLVDRTTYFLTADGACFGKIKASPTRVCAQIKVNKDEDDAWNWSFGSLYPDVIVRFQRPGRIPPPTNDN